MQGFLGGIFLHLKLSCPLKLRLNDTLACNRQAYSIVSKNTISYIFENLDLPLLNLFSRKITVYYIESSLM